MRNPYLRFLVGAALLGLVVFGLSRSVSCLTADSLRATDELQRNMRKH